MTQPHSFSTADLIYRYYSLGLTVSHRRAHWVAVLVKGQFSNVSQ